jgi:hypothetical protein
MDRAEPFARSETRSAHIAAAVASTTLARQRTLPVLDPLQPLLPEGALTRGRTMACRGVAATSLAVALAAEATAAGAWLAVVDVPWLGVEAVAELGVPLERLVRIDPGDTSGSFGAAWADLMAAVLDGFELVVTRIPRRVNAATLRRVLARVQARESVLVAVDDPGPLVPDISLDSSTPVWEGMAHGWGHLRGRRVTVAAAGRRIPRPRHAELWLPGPDGVVAAVAEPLDVPMEAPALRSVG